MPSNPILSVLLAFHNQRDEAESSLNALLGLEKIPLELIVIDDASSDGTGQVAQTLLDSVQHEHITSYICHSLPTGRGHCLNEALQKAESVVAWMPNSIHSINEKALQKAITTLRNGGSPCLTCTPALPSSLSEWPGYIQQGRLPENGKMLWNTELISPRDTFINPFLKRFHSVEWLLRLGMDTLEAANHFFRPMAKGDSKPFASDQKELLFTLMRRPGTTAEERRKVARLLADLRVNQEQE